MFFFLAYFTLYNWLQLLFNMLSAAAAAAAAKSLQSCLTLCDPIDGSPPGSPIPGILQARTLEWVAIPAPMHENEKWKWSRSVVSDSSRPHGLQPTRILRPWDFPGKSTGVECHCLLWKVALRTRIMEGKGLKEWVLKNSDTSHWLKKERSYYDNY